MARTCFTRTQIVATAVMSAFLCLPAAAWSSPADTNAFQLIDAGQDNLLRIVSPALDAPAGDDATSGNRISVTISGDGNGGWGQTWDRPLFGAGLPAPGLLQQIGWNNSISLDVSGTENLFSIVQAGSGNLASGQISGIGNAAAITQQGQGNTAHFSQAGSGNALSISQSSW